MKNIENIEEYLRGKKIVEFSANCSVSNFLKLDTELGDDNNSAPTIPEGMVTLRSLEG